MAFYFPELICSKGSLLKVKKDIVIDDFTIFEGDQCYVENVIGYAYDIYPKKNESMVFRMLNSDLNDYFSVIYQPNIHDEINSVCGLEVVFIKDLHFGKKNRIKKGERFILKSENESSHFDLYDTHRKVVRLSSSEVTEYLGHRPDPK